LAASSLASDPAIFALLSAVAVGAVLAALVWIAATRPALGFIGFFIFFAFAWRLVSVLYIDVLGPLFSEQLERDIGPGISAVPLAISQGLVIAALLFSFRPQRLRGLFSEGGSKLYGHQPVEGPGLADIAFWLASLFIAALWVELLLSGPIPLFASLERFDYSRLYGGPLHHLLMQWGPMLAFQLGIVFVAPTLNDRPFDRRFAVLFAILLLYLFLVGHRFSSFYAYSSFFIIPIGAALLSQRARDQSARTLFSGKALRYIAVAGVALCFLVIVAVAYSYLVVRRFEGAQLLDKLSQRILVQQGEMWWMTYERIFLQGDWNSGFAAYKLFFDPFNPNRNSTMQLLMELALPAERAHFILEQGSAYAGGWPEALFELGGPVGGFALAGLSAIIFSEFMFLVVRCIVQERFATCLFLTPILFALSIDIVSGMLNSFIQVTFVIKIAAALVVYVTEDGWRLSLFARPTGFESLPGLQKEACNE
jgi:Family of unknown function (DUF6418)